MARSIEQRGHHVTCELIGTSRKLAAYSYASSLALEQRLSTSWWIERYPKGRSRTCYQECGGHLKSTGKNRNSKKRGLWNQDWTVDWTLDSRNPSAPLHRTRKSNCCLIAGKTVRKHHMPFMMHAEHIVKL